MNIKTGRFLRNKPAAAGLLIVVIVLCAAVFGPLVMKTSPYTIDVSGRLMPPSRGHWFGTDQLGRDLFARVVYGARLSMTVAFSVGFISGVLGLIIGLAGGVFMRFCDGIKSIPSMLLAIALMTALGAGVKNVIIALAVVNTPNMARLARSAALVVKEQTYIKAMRSLGASPARILFRHIAPNIISTVITQMTFTFASSIIAEASLSFLGAGTPPPEPSWGSILAEGQRTVFTAQWIVIFPGIVTAMTVLGFNLLGDGVRDILDPLSS